VGRPRLIVGLTGGIGSGKSTVARRFAALGVPVIDADVIAREVVAPGEPCLEAIVDLFGEGVLDEKGCLNRRKLREQVFMDNDARHRLEAILHPAIRTRMLERLSQIDAPYAVLVIPLLLEAGQRDLVDRVLVVDTPPDMQVVRAGRRDGVAPEEVRRIMGAQIGREDRLAAADDVLYNSGDLDSLLRQTDALHEHYSKLAALKHY